MTDGAVEGVRTAIISRGDATPIFQSAKQALYEIASLVKLRVVDNRLFAAGAACNAGLATVWPLHTDHSKPCQDFAVLLTRFQFAQGY